MPCPLRTHYHMVSLLLRAGPDGMPVAALARALYSPGTTSYSVAYARTMRRIKAAHGALPIWEECIDGREYAGLDLTDWLASMREYGFGDAPALLVSPTGGR